MKQVFALLRGNAARTFAIVALVGLYRAAQLPSVSADERAALASRFHFEKLTMPAPPGPAARSLRPVHPSLAHMASWISAVGAGVALADLDGDGLANDACYVDTRTNRVIVAPTPGTGERYPPFALDFSGFRFDPTMAPMGCLPGHFTEGAEAELLVYFWGRTPVVFLRRKGGGGLSAAGFVAQELVPGDARWYSNAAVLADVDGDGHLDLIIGNYFPDGARILDEGAYGRELMQHSMSRAFNGGGPKLLLWTAARGGANPSVTYRDTSDAFPPEVRHGWTLAAAAADLDGDQLSELYLANDFGPDRLLHNRSTAGAPKFALVLGERRFTTPKSKTLGYDSYKGMGAEFADIDARGQLDLFVSNIAESYALEESNFVFMNTGVPALFRQGIAPFVDRAEAMGLSRGGWAWEARLADFDNSGALEAIQATGFVRGAVDRWPELQELAMANDQLLHAPASWLNVGLGDDISGRNRNPFFVRRAGGDYVDVSAELGLEPADKPAPSRGIAVADAFGDGRLDFAVANQWGETVFYRNFATNQNRFLGLHLRLPIGAATGLAVSAGHPDTAAPSRPAIGATAVITLPDGRQRMAQVDGGNGHSGKNSPELHLGLGEVAADAAIPVALQWRDTQGQVRRARVTLTPGWHTILLGGED